LPPKYGLILNEASCTGGLQSVCPGVHKVRTWHDSEGWACPASKLQ